MTDTSRKSRFCGGFRLLCVLGVFTWGIGQVWRDSFWLTGLFFYIPTPIIALVLLFAAICSAFCRNFRYVVFFAALLLAPVYFLLCVENICYRFDSNQPPGAYRAVHWNVIWGSRGWNAVRDKLDTLDADIYVLSEIPKYFSGSDFSAPYSLKPGGDIAVVSRFPLTLRKGYRQGRMRAYLILWEPPGKEILILIADLPSSIRIHRHPMLSRLREILSSTKASLLIGDLNAPRRSTALSDLPPGFDHAYQSVGYGWSYTWPSYFPVFAIDQCVHGPGIEPVAYQLEFTPLSDHGIQIFDFDIE
ncbi:hypothetical protein QUF76_12870 [Desulfobacterales bacterium HSG16]|nr:hypothetical protein [Desulfobacterales bacterium HSG16]